MKLALLALLFCGCASVRFPKTCASYCGMLIQDAGNSAVNCGNLEQAEASTIAAIDSYFCGKDYRLCARNICSSVFGWQLEADETQITVHDGARAVGLSYCGRKTMWVGDDNGWVKSAYPHELFHVAQNCEPGYDGKLSEEEEPYGHEGWTAMGIYDFLESFRGRK